MERTVERTLEYLLLGFSSYQHMAKQLAFKDIRKYF